MAEYRYPTTLADRSEFPAQIRFSYYGMKNAKEFDTACTDRILLYMPEQASQPSTVSWGSEKFGFVGETLVNTANAAVAGYQSNPNGDYSERLKAATESAINNAKGSLGGAAELTALKAGAYAGSQAAQFMGGNVSTDGMMGAMAGKIPNPYLTLIFEGINFRSFAFTFKFYPFQESDCDLIFDIYQTMRKNALPEYSGGSNSFLGYPKCCEIEYLWNGSVNPWLHKFKRAACTAIDIDYTGTGMFSVMRNGFPSCITVSTKWTELELVTADDVKLSQEAKSEGSY